MHTRRKQRKQRKQKKRTHGGRVIGEGTYGFVVSPAIPCEGRNVSHKVSKVFKKKENIRTNKQNRYMNFASRKSNLEPIIDKLRELDPDQVHFIRPEFCEHYGELSDELKSNGVTNESKYNSYLMELGGISFDVFDKYFNILDVAYNSEFIVAHSGIKTNQVMSSASHNRIIYNAMMPLVKQMIKLMDLIHDAGILHGDLHTGNILLKYEDSQIDVFFSKMRELVELIKSSESYKKYNRLIPDQIDIVYKSVLDFETVDLGKITIQIIDWDSAKLVDPSSNDTYEETSDILTDMLPSHYASDMLNKYFKIL